MTFGLIPQSSSELVAKFGVKNFPQLVVIPAPNVSPVFYNGKLTLQDMLRFLNQQLRQAEEERKKDTKGVFLELTKTSKTLCPKDSFCIILFVNPNKISNFVPILQEVQRAHPKFNVMWVNRTKQKSFEEIFNGEPNQDFSALFINTKRSKFVWLDEELTQQSLKLFIDKAVSGDVSWEKLSLETPLDTLV